MLIAFSLLIAGLLAANTIYIPIVEKSKPAGPSPTPTQPGGGGFVLQNPGFEEGQVKWTFFSNYGLPVVTTLRSHSGSRSARLGSDPITGQNGMLTYISQVVTIPSDKPKLRFWHYIVSEEVCGPFDWANVQLNSVEVFKIELCDGTDTQGSWQEVIVNLNAYKGQTFELKIYAELDATFPSDYYVDDFQFTP
jgi:hypothetical protein